MRARRSREEWNAVIAELEGSGEPLESFCRRRRVAPATLRWWRWRLAGAAIRAAPGGDVRLIAVDVLAPAEGAVSTCAPSSLAVVVADVNVRVELDVGADPAYVATLVAELRRRC